MGELFHIGPVVVYSYGTALAAAFLFGTFIASREARRHEIKPALVTELAVHLMAVSLVAGRLGYVLPRLGYYLKRPGDLLYIADGGLSYIPALLAGLWYVRRYAKSRDVSVRAMLDTLAPGLAVGLVVGSLGALESYVATFHIGPLYWSLPALFFFSIEYGSLWYLASTRRRTEPGGRFWWVLSADGLARITSSLWAVIIYGPSVNSVVSVIFGAGLFGVARQLSKAAVETSLEGDVAPGKRRRRLDRTARLKVAAAWFIIYLIFILILAETKR